jgi:PAS domain S-box-containing protein
LSSPLAGLGAAVLDALPISLYVVDRGLRVIAWNALREKGPYGRPKREALGRHLRDLLSADGFRTTRRALKQVIASGQPLEETVESRGAGRLFHVRRLPVYTGGQVTHVLSWFDDITERRALEMRLIASDRLAFLGQLAAGVAHEVANPLASIAGCAEVLASLAIEGGDRSTRRQAREFLDLIRGEVARCEKIVRGLLHSARPDPRSTADVGSVVATVLRLLERHPAFSRVRVISRIPADLLPARIDPDSLKQVVVALAVNAAQAMPGGGTLRFLGGREDGRVVLDVVDSGPGIPPEIRLHLFEPFFTTHPREGTGLGLAIARSLVRGRGGELLYRPRPRAGGSFRVLLNAAEGRT